MQRLCSHAAEKYNPFRLFRLSCSPCRAFPERTQRSRLLSQDGTEVAAGAPRRLRGRSPQADALPGEASLSPKDGARPPRREDVGAVRVNQTGPRYQPEDPETVLRQKQASGPSRDPFPFETNKVTIALIDSFILY